MPEEKYIFDGSKAMAEDAWARKRLAELFESEEFKAGENMTVVLEREVTTLKLEPEQRDDEGWVSVVNAGGSLLDGSSGSFCVFIRRANSASSASRGPCVHS